MKFLEMLFEGMGTLVTWKFGIGQRRGCDRETLPSGASRTGEFGFDRMLLSDMTGDCRSV